MNFLSAQNIARQALPLLKENLVFPLLSHIEYSDEFSRIGDTIQVRKPPVYTADEFDGTIKKQDASEQPVLVTLDKIADVSVEIGPKEMALSIEDFNKQVLEPAVVAIAHKINSDGLDLYKDISSCVGTSGETPDNIGVFANAVKALNKNKAPNNDRYAVWDLEALANLQTIDTVISAEKSGSSLALRDGSIGRILGLDNFMSQSIKNHSTKDASNITVAEDILGGTTMKLSGEGSLVSGDIITIDGENFAITSDITLSSSGVEVTLNREITAEISEGTEVAKLNSHTANLAFNKNAFAFVTRPLEKAYGAESYVINYEGLTLRITMDYDIATKKQILSVDTLYGFKTMYQELAVRILG